MTYHRICSSTSPGLPLKVSLEIYETFSRLIYLEWGEQQIFTEDRLRPKVMSNLLQCLVLLQNLTAHRSWLSHQERNDDSLLFPTLRTQNTLLNHVRQYIFRWSFNCHINH